MKYAVIRRGNIDGVDRSPGDIIEDPDRAVILIERGYVVPIEAPSTSPAPDAEGAELSISDLRARARELGLAASGSKVELSERIAAEEARLAEETVTSEQASSASPSVEEPAQLPSDETKEPNADAPTGDTPTDTAEDTKDSSGEAEQPSGEAEA